MRDQPGRYTRNAEKEEINACVYSICSLIHFDFPLLRKQHLYRRRIPSIPMAERFNVIVEQGEDGYLISEVVELPGCHTQAKTYDELLKRTKEAISLYAI